MQRRLPHDLVITGKCGISWSVGPPSGDDILIVMGSDGVGIVEVGLTAGRQAS